MKRLLAVSAVAAAMAFSAGALAQGYVGGSVGQSDFKVDCDPGFSCDTKDTGYKLFGGYGFTPYLAVEGAYVDLGKASESGSGTFLVDTGKGVVPVTGTGTASLKASGFGLWGVGIAPFGNASVFAKLGVASIKAKGEICVTLTAPAVGSGCDSDSKTTTDIAWGVGAGYSFTPNLGARIEWERFRAKIPDGDKFDIDLLSAGIVYRF